MASSDVHVRDQGKTAGRLDQAPRTHSSRDRLLAFDALSSGDSRPLVGLLADNVTWKVMGRTPWSREYHGKASVVDDLLRPPGSRLATRYRAHAHRIMCDGPFVVVQARGEATTKDGLEYDNEYCFVYRLECVTLF